MSSMERLQTQMYLLGLNNDELSSLFKEVSALSENEKTELQQFTIKQILSAPQESSMKHIMRCLPERIKQIASLHEYAGITIQVDIPNLRMSTYGGSRIHLSVPVTFSYQGKHLAYIHCDVDYTQHDSYVRRCVEDLANSIYENAKSLRTSPRSDYRTPNPEPLAYATDFSVSPDVYSSFVENYPAWKKIMDKAIFESVTTSIKDSLDNITTYKRVLQDVKPFFPYISRWIYTDIGGIVFRKAGKLLVVEYTDKGIQRGNKGSDILRRHALYHKIVQEKV